MTESWAWSTAGAGTFGETYISFPENETPTPVREYLESLPLPPDPRPGNPTREGGLWAVETIADRWEMSEDAGLVVQELLN